MLRVGLTGGLGSGKSTVAAMLRELGAHVIEADTLGREMMEPGHAVFDQILRHFGPEVLTLDGRLNRARLADLAFHQGRLHELNAIVHPPVIEAQRQWMEEVIARDPSAIAVIESALIFEVVRDALARGEKDSSLANWRRRIDRVVVITAPEQVRLARYAARVLAAIPSSGSPAPSIEAIEADALQRMKHQVPEPEKVAQADYLIDNAGDIAALRQRVQALWPLLKAESNKSQRNLSLQ